MHCSTMVQRKTFQIAHSSYKMGKLNWTPLPFESKKSLLIPSKRYLHTAVTFEDRLYILGGIDNESDFKELVRYIFIIENTMKWTIIETKNYCQSRNGHSCTVFKNEIYFFGGSQHLPNPTNDFFKFSPAQSSWVQIESEETVPQERQLANFVGVNNQYIFLYGGIDILQDKIYDDGFIFKDGKWAKLNITNNLSERIKMGVVVCGKKIFGFGGEGPSAPSECYFNTLYEIIINQFDLEMEFKQIQIKYGKAPQRRTAHGMSAISQEFFLVLGGQGLLEDNLKGFALGDIWIFDVREMIWTEIQTIYGAMTPRYEFSLSISKNRLFIFGGFSEENMVVGDLSKLQFLEDNTKTLDICPSCSKSIQQKDIRLNPSSVKYPIISSGFYYNIAMEISFPFKAISMIIDSAERLEAQSIMLTESKNKQQFDYFMFQFETQRHIPTKYILTMMESNEDQQIMEIVYNLKIGALRLGKTFIFISIRDNQRRVFLMSNDSKYTPNFEDSYTYYSYAEDLHTGQMYPANANAIKQRVCNILKTQIQDPYKLLSRRQGNLLTIFQVNILPTVEKAYYYELIFYTYPISDVKIYHNEKKNELLQSIGYSISNSPDFSLRSYLCISHLQRQVKLYVNTGQNPMVTESYLEFLESQRNQGIIQQIDIGQFQENSVEKCVIYRCDPDKYLNNNLGILIYCGNYLIDRHECKFGHLVEDKFYKKKYKSRHNLFKYAGVILISDALKLNLSKTKIRNKQRYNGIMQQLISKLKSLKKNRNDNEQDFHNLFEKRFANGRQPTKKVKRESCT